jgi:secondary thiamine-phosphate synthase enzyme
MKSFRKELTFETETRIAFINITDQVEDCIRESGIQEGLCLVCAMQVTASCFIGDNEKGSLQDLNKWVERMAPHEPLTLWKHNEGGEENGDATLKRHLMGREVVIAVTSGKADFGTWEQVFYGEFDGLRSKNVLVKIIGE